MIDILTPMPDGTIALQSAQVPFKRGQRVERTALARGTIRALGMESVLALRGTYTGLATGRYVGCIRVRVDGSKRAEPFKPELWKAMLSPCCNAPTYKEGSEGRKCSECEGVIR